MDFDSINTAGPLFNDKNHLFAASKDIGTHNHLIPPPWHFIVLMQDCHEQPVPEDTMRYYMIR